MKKTVLLFVCILLAGAATVGAQDVPPAIPIPVMPDCADYADVSPDVLIGGNVTISLGGLDMFQIYIDQASGSPTLSVKGEQMMGESLTLEGCFVDENSFLLFGEKGNLDVLFVGVALEPEFSTPTFGGLWYGWGDGYDADTLPDEKGFFFQLF